MGRARRRARNFTLGESIFFIPFPTGFLPTTLQSAVGLLFIQIIHHAQMGFIFSSFLSLSLSLSESCLYTSAYLFMDKRPLSSYRMKMRF